jgi:predicted deacylase
VPDIEDKAHHGDSLDRRAFLRASAAAVGASATLAANAASAQARSQPAPVSTPGTAFTGDVIDGRHVVTMLDVGDLEPGRTQQLYFRGVEAPSGQHWHVSVTVARGARPGKRAVLVSGVHGDEMSSIHTVHTLMNHLDPAAMSGTVMAVTDVSRPALEGMQRRWPNAGRGIDLIDMNRQWPGDENGASAPSRHAGLLFNRLLRPNADFAIDFHTGTTGFEVAAFNIGEMGRPEVRAMVEMFPVGLVFDNPVYPGVLHNAFIDAGIPSFCPEIGAARIIDPDMIALFVEGTMNVLRLHGILEGPTGRTALDVDVFTGNAAFPVLATSGGIVEYSVRLGDRIEPGQRIAVQRNGFGEVVAEYASGVDGVVTGLRSDAMAEPGNPLAFILFTTPAPAETPSYPE